MAVKSYEILSDQCNYPLHLGITEAGGLITGSIKSSIGMGRLLMNGIGDTIRVSLSADPEEEVKAGYEILKSLNLRSRGVKNNFMSFVRKASISSYWHSKVIREKIVPY